MPTVIPAGENVVLLNTPKGVYLRLPDGRFFAIRGNDERSLVQSQSNELTSPPAPSNIPRSITSTTNVNTQPICSTITPNSTYVNMFSQRESAPTYYRANSIDPSNGSSSNQQGAYTHPRNEFNRSNSVPNGNTPGVLNEYQNFQFTNTYNSVDTANPDTTNRNDTSIFDDTSFI